MGQPARFAWHKETSLGDAEAVILPGGFSYGDYLRAGAMAANSPIMGAVKAFADKGGPVLAICNGYQIACEAGLLDGALTRNASLHFECRDVHLLVEGKPTPWTRAIPAGPRPAHPDRARRRALRAPERRRARKGGARRLPLRRPDGRRHRRRQPQRLGRQHRRHLQRARQRRRAHAAPRARREAVLGCDDGKMLFASLLAEMGRRV